MLSPYFSLPKKSQKFFKQSTTDQVPNSSLESPEEEHDDQTMSPLDQALLTDPLFLFYYRRFLDLYQRLAALKPILIQGNPLSTEFQLFLVVGKFIAIGLRVCRP
jgi:hypothetical protein